jgi:hypothetical protein
MHNRRALHTLVAVGQIHRVFDQDLILHAEGQSLLSFRKSDCEARILWP